MGCTLSDVDFNYSLITLAENLLLWDLSLETGSIGKCEEIVE